MAGKIFCVVNNKGGVGKTTIAVNLSAALSFRDKKVLIIDNDPQSDSSTAVLPKEISVKNSLYQLLDPDNTNKPDISSCIYNTIHKNLFILPNIPETDGLEIPFAQNFPESYHYLRNAVREYANQNFDITLIDCPPTLSLFVANAMFCSDLLLIPTDVGSNRSSSGIEKVLKFKEQISDGNPDLNFFKILMNRIDKRKNVHKAILEDIKNTYGSENIFDCTIPTSTFFEAIEFLEAETIFSYAKKTVGAQAFRKAAQEISTYLDQI